MTTSNTKSSTFPVAMLHSLWTDRHLIYQMTQREIIGRYKGSVIGLAWSLFNPLLMLMVYTFVFSVVFEAKWGTESQGGQGEFSVILFTGMIVFNLFSECFNRSPILIVSNVNYVKKVVFPLEILSWVVLGNSLFHALISLVVLLAAELILLGHIPLTALLLPVVLLPFLMMLAGMSWFLAAAGVFIRDIGQTTGVLTTVLMFTSPLFFPLSALPESIQPWLLLNPLAFFIEETRRVVIWGSFPSPESTMISYLVGLLVASVGYTFFQKTRKGFADVL